MSEMFGELAQRAHGEGRQDHHHADPAVALGPRFGRVFLELAQEQQARQDRDQRPVAVFGKRPGLQQRVETVDEEDTRRNRGDGEPDQTPGRKACPKSGRRLRPARRSIGGLIRCQHDGALVVNY
jgi:hypothetical protein